MQLNPSILNSKCLIFLQCCPNGFSFWPLPIGQLLQYRTAFRTQMTICTLTPKADCMIIEKKFCFNVVSPEKQPPLCIHIRAILDR